MPRGEALALVDDQKNGAIRAFYKDPTQKNWVDVGMIYQNGKPVPGSGFEGQLDFDFFKAATSYMKGGKDDIFYTVVQAPSLLAKGMNTSAYVQRPGDGRTEAVGIQDVSKQVSIQAGYFTLDSESFFGVNSPSSVKGASAGAIVRDTEGKNIVSVKGYAGTEGQTLNVQGLEGRIRDNTFVSYFVRRDEGLAGKPTNENIEASHVQYLGKDSQLRTSFRQILGSDQQSRGSGTIELTTGDWRVAFSFDNITTADYWSVLNGYLQTTSSITSVRQLLDATRDYFNSNVLLNTSYPEAQFEIGKKGFGKIRITSLKDGGGAVSYTDADGKNRCSPCPWTMHVTPSRTPAMRNWAASASHTWGPTCSSRQTRSSIPSEERWRRTSTWTSPSRSSSRAPG